MIDIKSAADDIGISVEAYRRLCSLFLSAMEDDLEGMQKALEDEEREELKKRAHHIKGASLNLEFIGLSRKAEAIQSCAIEADFDILRSEFLSLSIEYDRVKQVLEALL